jgi:hypothetical protein
VRSESGIASMAPAKAMGQVGVYGIWAESSYLSSRLQRPKGRSGCETPQNKIKHHKMENYDLKKLEGYTKPGFL